MKDLVNLLEEFEEWFYGNPENACFHCFSKEYKLAWKKWKSEHRNTESLNTEKSNG